MEVAYLSHERKYNNMNECMLIFILQSWAITLMKKRDKDIAMDDNNSVLFYFLIIDQICIISPEKVCSSFNYSRFHLNEQKKINEGHKTLRHIIKLSIIFTFKFLY